jgi:hypothetical protein
MTQFFDPGLEKKPDFIKAMRRIYAWYDHQVLDRAPVRFSPAARDMLPAGAGKRWPDLVGRWFDAQYQVEHFLSCLGASSYLGETFPVFYPNLGPNVFAAMLGGHLTFGEATSWIKPSVETMKEAELVRFDGGNPYYRKILEITDCALDQCRGRFLVGYTDMHPGLDCVDALMGTEAMLLSMVDDPAIVKALGEICTREFFRVMDIFHDKLQAKRQLSVSWMQIPFYETMHIPSCDLGAMISNDMFRSFALPMIREEIKHFRHNIFHLDGKGVAVHLHDILALDEVQAIQWVQGAGSTSPILQWVDLIRRIQAAGKSVVVGLTLNELEPFLEAVRPEGILLCLDEPERETQQAVINRLLKWK